MSIISLLPDHIANQIAAGEVIQRPASVVKEMMENAIDAGATKIDVIIKDAGKTLIQIVDNGDGMSTEDAEMCFARHATSKLKSADDLFALATKGFRGEALASISAIAHVTLKTKQPNNETGTLLTIEGSTITCNEPTICSNGSSFEVKNLFFNVPARRNFLKSNDVEFKHIREEFERIVLAHPELDFSLTNNGTEVYKLPSALLRKRIVDLIGDKQNERLVPIEEETDIVKLRGYVVKPEFAKKTRGDQYLFVNHRFFKSAYFNHALTKAFEGLVQPKTFPGYFLYMEVDPSKIDVNVHPTKTEIKFEEERLIYAIIVSSVRQALGKYNIAPTLDFERETSFDLPNSMRNQPVVEPTIKVDTDFNPFQTTSSRSSSGSSGASSKNFTQAIQSQGFGNNSTSQKDWDNFYGVNEIEEIKEEETPELEFSETQSASQYLIRSPYVLTPTKSGLMVTHINRGFERIYYDQMMRDFISKPIVSQALLFPIEIECSKNEAAVWEEHYSLLNRLGFTGVIKDDVLHLSAVPNMLEAELIPSCVADLFSSLVYQEVEKGEIAHIFIMGIAKNACKKKTLVTTKEEAAHFIETLFQCPEHAYSPSGKTIIQSLSIDELNAKF